MRCYPGALIDFASNDYLGLSRHPALAARAAEFAARYGTGAGASRLVTGSSPLHSRIEARIAALKGAEAALLFASGWQANASVLPALAAALERPAIFADHDIHASLLHGCAAAGLRAVRWRHHDLAHLDRLLGRHGGQAILLTESVFSMDGTRADLAGLRALADRHDAFLYVDDAHATGVLGAGGAGLAHAGGAAAGADLVVGTASKALGGFGAYVAGSATLCRYLVNACSGFVHTTAPPPPVLGAIEAALDLLPGMAAERAQVAAASVRLRDGLAAMGLETLGSATQIVPVLLGDEAAALAMADALERAGFLTVAIRPPTVAPGRSRLRLAVQAAHGMDTIDALLGAIGEVRGRAAA